MNQDPAIVLGFDYGTKRIGVAIGQSLTRSARPLETLHARDDTPDWGAITRLIRTWRPASLVVGLPIDMDGSEQDVTVAARRFSRQLNGRYNLPVHLMDERLSSIEACSRLRAQGRPTNNRDAMAAQVILESWLTLEAYGTP